MKKFYLMLSMMMFLLVLSGCNQNNVTYTLTFHSNGGEAIEPIDIVEGQTINLPIPIREGHTFNGWYTGPGPNDIQFSNITPVIQNLTLYARWQINQYTIKFDTDGGISIASLTKEFDSIISVEEPTKEGHTFAGWNPEIPERMPAENITISAQWETNKYTITFKNSENSNLETITLAYNKSISLSPVKEGHTFVGWKPELPAKMPAENIITEALWQINQYTILFESNGGTSIASLTQNFNSILIEPENPKREGHTFIGWFTDPQQTKPYSFSTMPAENQTLYAKWELNAYSVIFNVNGGQYLSELSRTFGAEITNLPEPSREGYSFLGWYLDSELNQSLSKIKMPANNLILHARWEPIEFKINYILNDGVNHVNNPRSFTVESSNLTLQSPAREGYIFHGWYTDSDYVNRTFTVDSNILADLNLYARWRQETKIEDYFVVTEFDSEPLRSGSFRLPDASNMFNLHSMAEQLLENTELLNQSDFRFMGRTYTLYENDMIDYFVSNGFQASNRTNSFSTFVNRTSYSLTTRTYFNYYVIRSFEIEGKRIIDLFYFDEITYSSSSHEEEELTETFFWYGTPLTRFIRIVDNEIEFYFEQTMNGRFDFYDLRMFKDESIFSMFSMDKLPNENHQMLKFIKFKDGFWHIFETDSHSRSSMTIYKDLENHSGEKVVEVLFNEKSDYSNYLPPITSTIFLRHFDGWSYFAGKITNRENVYAIQLENEEVLESFDFLELSNLPGLENTQISLAASMFEFAQQDLEWLIDRPLIHIQSFQNLSELESIDLVASIKEYLELSINHESDIYNDFKVFGSRSSELKGSSSVTFSMGDFVIDNGHLIILDVFDLKQKAFIDVNSLIE